MSDGAICTNAGCSCVLDMMKVFALMNNEPMFFILELPRRRYEGITESMVLRDVDDCDVYFIDGPSREQIRKLIDAVGNFLVKDGPDLLGIGGRKSHEDIFFGWYNIISIFTQNAHTYHNFFDKLGKNKPANPVTARDIFNEDHPGECRLLVSKITPVITNL